MRVGRCACSFCRRHGARTSGDPAGSVEFRAEPGSLSRYRFGLGITDYLLCAKCGTYVGAVMPDEGGQNGDLASSTSTRSTSATLSIPPRRCTSMTARTRRAGAPGGESSG